MKKRTIQQVFVAFLKNEGVFDAYVERFGNGDRLLMSRAEYVTQAFDWKDWYFWKDIDTKWRLKLKTIKETNPVYYHTRCNNCGRLVKRTEWILKTESDYTVCNNCALRWCNV